MSLRSAPAPSAPPSSGGPGRALMGVGVLLPFPGGDPLGALRASLPPGWQAEPLDHGRVRVWRDWTPGRASASFSTRDLGEARRLAWSIPL